MDFSKFDLFTDSPFDTFIGKLKDFYDYSNQLKEEHKKRLDKSLNLIQIQDKISKYKTTIFLLDTKLKQIQKENIKLLSEIEEFKVISSQYKEMQLIKNDIHKIFSNFQKQNKEIKDDIQDIKNKIIEFKEEIKQYIHPPNEPIQKKKEETFNSLKEELEKTKTSILPEIKSIKETLVKYKDISTMKEEFKKLENLLLSIQIDTNYLSKGIVSQPLKKLEDYISINNIHSNSINSIIELQDKRIALCSYDKSITVYSINYEEKKWTQDIKQVKAHEYIIDDICEISMNTLASVSEDKKIKIWKVNKNNLELLSTLTKHTQQVYKVITLSEEQFATCSSDKTIKIWSNVSPFNEVKTLTNDGDVSNMIKLKTKEIILSTNWSTMSIDFWDLKNYTKITSIKGVYTHRNSHEMIELPNMFVAVSLVSEGNPIVIIDPINYCIVKTIKDPEYITDASALCVLDCHSFIYVKEGKVLQISIHNDYEIIYKNKDKNKLRGWGEMITITNAYKLIIIPNKSNGIEIMKLIN